MRLLVDANLSPRLTDHLSEAGHDVIHVRDRGLQGAEDDAVLDLADRESRVVISADTDFSGILARRRVRHPSFILIRRRAGRRTSELSPILVTTLNRTEPALTEGAIVVVEDTRIRVRRLPLL